MPRRVYWIAGAAHQARRRPSLPEPVRGDQAIDHSSRAGSRTPASGLQALLDGQRQRAQRLSVFAEELVRGVRREFGPCWMAGAPAAGTPGARALVQATAACYAEVQQVRALLNGLDKLPPQEALERLKGFDADRLITRTKALQAAADAMRARKPVAATPTKPLDPLRKWLTKLAPDASLDQRPTAAGGADPVGDRPRKAFDAAMALATQVLAYVSPRLNVLQVALRSTGLPGPAKPLDQVKRELHPAAVAAGVPEGQLGFLPPLVKLFYADKGAVRTVDVALVQWGDLRGRHAEAGMLTGTLRGVRPEQAPALLDAFDVGKYRAAIYPLSHLHLAFAPVPHARELFPPPADAKPTGGRTWSSGGV